MRAAAHSVLPGNRQHESLLGLETRPHQFDFQVGSKRQQEVNSLLSYRLIMSAAERAQDNRRMEGVAEQLLPKIKRSLARFAWMQLHQRGAILRP